MKIQEIFRNFISILDGVEDKAVSKTQVVPIYAHTKRNFRKPF